LLQNILKKITYANLLNIRKSLPAAALWVLILAGCSEDPGVVGGSFVDESSEVYSDTLNIEDVRSSSDIPDFSGNLEHFSAGLYNDPALGEFEAVAIMRPSISQSYNIDSLRDVEFSDARLQFVANTGKFYGDTTSTTTFELRPVTHIWRPGSWRSDSLPSYGSTRIGQPFEVTNQDTFEVDLPDTWLQEYREYFNSDVANRDSVYRYNFNGMAIVAQNQSKIVPFNRQGTRLMIKNREDTAYKKLPMESVAFGFNRNEPAQMDSTLTPVVGLFDNAMILNPELNEQTLGSQNLSRVELALYEDQETLNNLPVNHVRPGIPEMRVYRRSPDEVRYGISQENRLYRVAEDSLDNSYRINLTSYVNQIIYGQDPGVQFYVVPESSSGVIYATLLYNSKSAEFRPKVLVTGAKTESVN